MKKVYRKDWSCKLNWQFLMSIHILYHQTLFEVNVFYPCHSNKKIQQSMSYATFIVHFIFTMHVYQVFFHVHHNFTVFATNKQNQRLPGACNRSPGSKLLSITTQLHCGGHLGGRAQLPDTILEEDHPMTIPSKFGFNWATGSKQDGFYVNFP